MTIKCLNCNKEFYISPSRFGIRKCCCHKCYSQLRFSQVKYICKWCGKEFETFKSRKKYGRAMFCSRICRYKATSGENHYHWKGGYENTLMHSKKRRARKLNAEGSHTFKQWNELKAKYNFMCLCCKQYEPFITLTEDHIIPLSKGGNNYIENIQPLCRSCNSRKHTKTINYLVDNQLKELCY